MRETPDSGGSATAPDSGSGPVGSGDHVVQQGECLSSIASAAGHFWQTIWDHPDNAEVKRIRKDPNILLPGDRVTVPPIQIKLETRPTDQTHRFVRKGEPAHLRIRVMSEDDQDAAPNSTGGAAGSGTPRRPRARANQPYLLMLDGVMLQGRTDATGLIDIPIPPGAHGGTLRVGPDNMIVPIQLGAVDPLNETSGIQERLNNLGFNCGPPDGTANERLRAAVTMFQRMYSLQETGELNQETIQKIKDVHGS